MKKKLLCLTLCALLFGSILITLKESEDPRGWGVKQNTILRSEDPRGWGFAIEEFRIWS